MRTLQVRIALILTAAIAAVMLVATAATFFMVMSGEAARMVGPVADRIEQAVISGDGQEGDNRRPPRDRGMPMPPDGPPVPDLTQALTETLRRLGLEGKVQVVLDPRTGEPVAAYDFGQGRWGLFRFPRAIAPPPQAWLALGAWLLLVLCGVLAVAMIMARRVTQPFAVLERAVTSVGPDGILPHVPEQGSGEVRHTAAVLNRLSDRLRTSMESRMRLVAAAGHDLRTPMTRMRLRAEFLPEEERESWLADLDELDLIADSAIRLVKEEGAGEARVPVDLAALVASVADDLKAMQLPATVGALAPAAISAGPLALRRALRNVAINAATHGGGAIFALSADGRTATLCIEDNGPGIPPDLMAQVFEPFFRAAPGRTRLVKGAGLGLAIAKDIIERFGGTITIANRPEGGLRQTIRFPQVTP